MFNTYHSEVLEWTSRLNVLESLLQVLQLCIDLALGLLCALHSLGLESLDGLDLPLDIVFLGLETVELLLNVGDDILVLQHAAVVREVDGLGLLRQDLDLAARVIVALLEVGEGICRVASQAEFGAKVGPVDLEGSRTLWWEYELAICIPGAQKLPSAGPVIRGRGTPRAAGTWIKSISLRDRTYRGCHCDGWWL